MIETDQIRIEGSFEVYQRGVQRISNLKLLQHTNHTYLVIDVKRATSPYNSFVIIF